MPDIRILVPGRLLVLPIPNEDLRKGGPFLINKPSISPWGSSLFRTSSARFKISKNNSYNQLFVIIHISDIYLCNLLYSIGLKEKGLIDTVYFFIYISFNKSLICFINLLTSYFLTCEPNSTYLSANYHKFN